VADAYAELPYPGHPYARTHPDHLALLARLHELKPADPDRCRVVELACGDGMNIVAMAAAAPGVHVAGVDVDASAIARGQAVAAELGIEDRVDLRAGDLVDAPDLGPADYVICHGLYTWAPPRVADAALAALAGHLGPDGVGFLSFNLRPGWTVRRPIGPVLARDGSDPRALLAALAPALADRDDAYGALVAAELARLAEVDDPLLVHDDLGPHTTAAWHADVVTHADHHGLRILRDAHPDTLRGRPAADQALSDLASGQPYREIVLVPAAAPAAAQPTVDGVASLLTGPERRPVAGLEEAERLLAGLQDGRVRLHDHDTDQFDRLHAAPARHASAPGERPVAFALARLQARQGGDVTTLRHTRLRIEDDAGRAILSLCDGSRDHPALAHEAALALGDAALEPRLAAAMPAALERLCENALLVDRRAAEP
jgi:hypothetical protein